jgi:Tfp pilus assembly protein PilF
LVLLPLLPVCNLVPIYRAAADRYLYLPLAGVALVIACLLEAPAIAQQSRTRKAACLTAALFLCLLAANCVWRQQVWSNPLALWEDTVQKNPASPTAQGGLAESLWEAGRLPEAEQAARNAISLTAGTAADHWLCLALILADAGRGSAAQEMLQKALAIDPRLANPDQRVAGLAMDQRTATALRALLAARATGR